MGARMNGKITAGFVLAAGLLLAGCGGDDDAGAAATSGSTSASSAPAATAPATTEAPDTFGVDNCVTASLAYGAVLGDGTGPVDLETTYNLFTAPDTNPASSAAGRAATTAILELNYQMALERVNVLTGQPVDGPKLQSLWMAVRTACATVR